jgi:chemotaxis-related protein WspD
MTSLNPQITASAGELAPARISRLVAEACWQTIGVFGTSTCPELKRHIHCRNCPVHGEAAARLLDRSHPAGYRAEQTDYFAAPRVRRPARKASAILFRVQSEWLALPTQAIQEVSDLKPAHTLPHRRHSIVLGVLNIRGELTVCIALDRLISLSPARPALPPARPRERLIVMNTDGDRVCFPAAEVFGIHHFMLDQLQRPPATIAEDATCYTHGILSWKDHTVGFLDFHYLASSINRLLS